MRHLDSAQRIRRHAPWLAVVGTWSAALFAGLALVAANDTPAPPADTARQLSARYRGGPAGAAWLRGRPHWPRGWRRSRR